MVHTHFIFDINVNYTITQYSFPGQGFLLKCASICFQCHFRSHQPCAEKGEKHHSMPKHRGGKSLSCLWIKQLISSPAEEKCISAQIKKRAPDTHPTWVKNSGKEKIRSLAARPFCFTPSFAQQCFLLKENHLGFRHQHDRFWKLLQYFTCLD